MSYLIDTNIISEVRKGLVATLMYPPGMRLWPMRISS